MACQLLDALVLCSCVADFVMCGPLLVCSSCYRNEAVVLDDFCFSRDKCQLMCPCRCNCMKASVHKIHAAVQVLQHLQWLTTVSPPRYTSRDHSMHSGPRVSHLLVQARPVQVTDATPPQATDTRTQSCCRSFSTTTKLLSTTQPAPGTTPLATHA